MMNNKIEKLISNCKRDLLTGKCKDCSCSEYQCLGYILDEYNRKNGTKFILQEEN
jgi:hypothetical protein